MSKVSDDVVASLGSSDFRPAELQLIESTNLTIGFLFVRSGRFRLAVPGKRLLKKSQPAHFGNEIRIVSGAVSRLPQKKSLFI
jgi:hypothetical protein